MNDLDERIREALGPDALPQDYDPSADESLVYEALALWRGRRRRFMWMITAVMLAMFGGSIWCAIAFFGATAVRDQIMWAVMFMFGQMAVGMLKLWVWLQMDKHELKREVKRLELQIVRLVDRLG